MDIRELVFVYNEDSSPIAMVMGFAHRVVSPETYECRLCDITYDRFTMKAEWRRFLDQLGLPASFHFRNRFVANHPAHAAQRFPMVLFVDGAGQTVPLLTAERVNAITTLADLESAVAAELNRVRVGS